jgi:hypothetical protein
VKDISIQFQNFNSWVFFLIAIAVILIYLSFWNPRKKLGKNRIIVLILRSLALIVIFLLILHPVVRWTDIKKLPPKLIVLIDNSMSAGTQKDFNPDSLLTILNEVNNELREKDISIEYELFSDTIRNIGKVPDKVSFDGINTDIVNVIKEANSKYRNDNVCAMLLISDGVVTKGEDPSLSNLNLPFPVFTIGIGDTTDIVDPSVINLKLPQSAKVGDSITITADVVSIGSGEPLEVVLKENGNVIQKKLVSTQKESFIREIDFQLVPTEAGNRRYEVEIIGDEDFNPHNNMRMGILRVNSDELRVLILNSKAGFESKFLKRTLEKIEDIYIVNAVENGERWVSPTSFSFKEKWDLIIFLDYPSVKSDYGQMEMVKNKLETEKIPILIFFSEMILSENLKKIIGEIDIKYELNTTSKRTIITQMHFQAKSHPVLRELLVKYGKVDPFHLLPPLGWNFKSLEISDEFIPLLVTTDIEVSPVIAVSRSSTEQRLALCFGSDFWRWDFMMQDKGTYDLYVPLFTSLVRWLSDTLSASNVQIYSDKLVYLSGETIKLVGHVFDINGEPIKTAVINGKIIDDNEYEKLFLMQWSGDKYSASLEVTPGGKYKIVSEVYVGNEKLDTKSSEINVIEQPIELIKIKQNPTVLRSIANQTNGDMIKMIDICNIQNLVDFKTMEKEEYKELKLWRWYGFFVLLVMLLFIEWIIRRINGYQ